MEVEPIYYFNTIQGDVKRLALQTLEQVLKDKTYHPVDVSVWVQEITSSCLQSLKNVADGAAGFKFLVNCTIVQKKNGGFHTNTSCFWNAETDGQVVVRYESSTFVALCSIYAISLL
ncbi:unnamed protein product [Aphanomyces euteiches]|uniref:Uncharacterized protein n=1 Tax=Aphanomyces euteiches TaxID=100861 RepID=A0A6G0XSY6_9STRA|nr:hypothetical protein Ae201684_001783 [Aphanomyces euteiches]KAH9071806.1 hypothetical protein Ae201684P_020065 [Aphanomyces euteiches]KAH9103886.1 hypothetical protein AeMF1_019883 [Aphanomyces euteiches]KAH9160940.1 hypothetical protein LEN26_001646 [Aphanomyces euteiches]KAH9186505.1 hypothetical protein AeNC1_011521 [Aphanomyces euteiches]